MPSRILILFVLIVLIGGCQGEKTTTGPSVAPTLKPLHSETPFANTDSSSGKLFDILTAQSTGLNFSNDIRMSYDIENWTYPYLFVGAGVAVGDINNDDLPDVLFCGNLSGDKLFLNKGGLKFENVSDPSGISESEGWSTGATMVDINNDSYLDIYLCRSWYPDDPEKRRNQFYINNGNNTFSEKATEMGLADTSFSIHASFFDYDLDGDLDVYVVSHPVDWNERRKYNNHEKIEQNQNSSDKLFRNNGDLKFEDVSLSAGINNHGFGLAVTTGDFNDDNWPDILVTNDWGMPDHLYLNQQDGTFKDAALSHFTKNSFSAMGSDFADINHDGHYDLAVAEMDFQDNRQHKSFIHSRLSLADLRNMEQSGYHSQYYRNTLQLNNGDGTFSEVARLAGTGSTDWSWSMLFMDADNDSYADLFVSNGNYRTANLDERPTIQKLRTAARRQDKDTYNELVKTFDTTFLKSPNTIFKNNGDLTFSKMNQEWGTNLPSMSHGAAYADFDNDGDLDIVTNNTNESAFLYRNNANQKLQGHNYLQLMFEGPSENILGIGVKVLVKTANQEQIQTLVNTRGYASCSQAMLHFGLGRDTALQYLEVKWPDGRIQAMRDISVNQRLHIKYQNAQRVPTKKNSINPVLFKPELNSGLDFVHKENNFDDFYRNPLLPKAYSRGGPAIALSDVNGDGLVDCFIGAAAGEPGVIYVQTKEQQFVRKKQPALEKDALHEDMGALFFDSDGDGDADLYVVSGGSDFMPEDSLLQDRLYLNNGNGTFEKSVGKIPDEKVSGSVVSAADFDRDGDLDLFVGGQIQSGQYPSSPASVLLENRAGTFYDVTAKWAPEIKSAGMVQTALWTDINNDQKIDLIIAGEWMPIRMFKNTGSTLEEITNEAGLQNTHGWWNSISSADFDLDGDMDYVLGNHGENFRYKPENEKPLEIYYADFDQDQDIDPVLSFYYHDKKYPVTYLDDLAGEMPFIGNRVQSYTSYGMSTTEEVLGKENFKKANYLKADLFSSVYLENKGQGKFAWRSLPKLAQTSSVYGLVTGDFNNDGNPDVLLHGNYSGFQPQFEKQDGLTGLLLQGDGTGNFEPLPSFKSGFWNREEGRSLVKLHQGSSEKALILAAVNDGVVKVHSFPTNKNWKVVLEPDEYAGIITFKDNRKQQLEFYYGEGYLSQHSRIIFLNAANIEELELVRYSGGKRTIKPE